MYEKQATYILILMMYRCLCFLQSFDLVYVLVFASLSSPLSADEVGAVPLQSGRGHVSAAWHVREPGNHPWIGFTSIVEPLKESF